MTDCGNCLSELWTVLYLAAERAQEILAAQAEGRAWRLRGPAAEGMEATARRRRRAGCLHVRARLGGLTGPGPVRYSLQCSKR
jgi:hypothetical protein